MKRFAERGAPRRRSGRRIGFCRAALLAFFIPFGLWVSAAQAAGGLQEQLRALAEARGFMIDGLGLIGEDPAGHAEGTPIEQVRHLLQGYNYVLTQERPGVIGQVRIISRRGESAAKGSSSMAYIEARRVGAHLQVDATLIGPNSIAKSVPMLVDTGASTLVLPASLMNELGFSAQNLRDGTSQTASGAVPIKLGLLRTVRIGSVSAADVEVSFIADENLKGNRLLGMSFLQRFKMTIDDAKNELILMTR